MDLKFDRNLFAEALIKYGVNKQLIMVIEEMSELTKEICKSFRTNTHNITPIIEEMADVYIMLEQLKIILPVDSEKLIQDVIDRKLERLKERLRVLSSLG